MALCSPFFVMLDSARVGDRLSWCTMFGEYLAGEIVGDDGNAWLIRRDRHGGTCTLPKRCEDSRRPMIHRARRGVNHQDVRGYRTVMDRLRNSAPLQQCEIEGHTVTRKGTRYIVDGRGPLSFDDAFSILVD